MPALSTSPLETEPGGDDSEVIRRILDGDSEAFREIVDRYHRKVLGLVYRHCGGSVDTVEDHAQEVFLRVFRGIRNFQGDAALGTWIHRIAINYLIGDARRRRALKRGRPTLSLDAPLQSKGGEFVAEVGSRRTDPSVEIQNEEKGVVIRDAIEALDDDLREIILMREIEQMSYEDISSTLDIPIGTVRSRIHRARGILQEKLKDLL